ncbi:MAG TPA: Lar family restriction alleviation protein [Bacteroidia bacterium]|nr:Lar family restriction alleviation protein [Bacteroidia bacterium]
MSESPAPELTLSGCPICGHQPTENHTKYWTGMRNVIAMYWFRCNWDSDHRVEARGKTLDECITNWNKRSSSHERIED